MVKVSAVSFGGGVQSTALLVLAAQHRIDFDVFVFANVGDRAENPDTLAYYGKHAAPFAEAHGIELVHRRWVTRAGQERDLYDDVMTNERDVPIPVRLGSGDFANRKCTSRYKIEVVARELRARGATAEEPATLALGISTDEIERARPGVPKQQPWTDRVYPLLDLGLSRTDCADVITAAGLPVPPKSSCWFCPFQGVVQWRAKDADTIDRAQALEDVINERRARLGRDRVGLLSPRLALTDAIHYQEPLFGDDCDSGFCFT